jgi:hypothetical protein
VKEKGGRKNNRKIPVDVKNPLGGKEEDKRRQKGRRTEGQLRKVYSEKVTKFRGASSPSYQRLPPNKKFRSP